jgi:hypothetical protein
MMCKKDRPILAGSQIGIVNLRARTCGECPSSAPETLSKNSSPAALIHSRLTSTNSHRALGFPSRLSGVGARATRAK